METGNDPQGGAVLSREAIVDAVRRIVEDVVSWSGDPIGEQDSLAKDVGCDSLDLVEIMMGVEEHLDIDVPDEVAEGLDTIGDIADRVQKLLAQPSVERP